MIVFQIETLQSYFGNSYHGKWPYELSGKCLRNLCQVAEGSGFPVFEETFQTMGCFKLATSDGGEDHDEKYSKVAHISGKEVELEGGHRSGDWEIKDNMHFYKAIMKQGLVIISLHEVFSSKGVHLEPPLNILNMK